jgi:hypothetical protein
MLMTKPSSAVRIVVTALTAALAVEHLLARVDVKVEFDKTFDFASVRTWGWAADGPGQVLMARTQEDDPEAMRQRVEPVIVASLVAEFSTLGLQSGAANPDLLVTYYLLLTTTMSAQTLGQFLPATPVWGLPPFPAATQSLEVMNQGSLVLDLSAGDKVVWRGVAQAKIATDTDDRRRRALVRESVRDLLRRYPTRR